MTTALATPDAPAQLHATNPGRDAFSCAGSGERAGSGSVRVGVVGGRTALLRARANSPLKLLSPRPTGTRGADAAWVFSSTYGGGLVSGDAIDLRVEVDRDACLLLGTQASTKVYRSTGGQLSRQALSATVAPGGVLVALPDPVTCFAGANYEQVQRVDLAPGASLVLLDWLTSGRRARGERWAFRRYRSRTDVYAGETHLMADRLLLDPADGALNGPHRLGRFECIATVILIGPAFERAALEILHDVGSTPLPRRPSLVDAAGPLAGGAVLRVLGEGTEQVGAYLRKKLRFVRDRVGDDPWARKW